MKTWKIFANEQFVFSRIFFNLRKIVFVPLFGSSFEMNWWNLNKLWILVLYGAMVCNFRLSIHWRRHLVISRMYWDLKSYRNKQSRWKRVFRTLVAHFSENDSPYCDIMYEFSIKSIQKAPSTIHIWQTNFVRR